VAQYNFTLEEELVKALFMSGGETEVLYFRIKYAKYAN
jgi:hypothetical protein